MEESTDGPDVEGSVPAARLVSTGAEEVGATVVVDADPEGVPQAAKGRKAATRTKATRTGDRWRAGPGEWSPEVGIGVTVDNPGVGRPHRVGATVASEMGEPASTRDLLLDAAARLFAERGIDNVSLAEIVRTAGQRNMSAVHYHFGNRDEILRAVLARHVPAIAERRRDLLQRARARPGDVRSAAEAIVRPVTEFAQRGWRERAYLQIGAELSRTIDREPGRSRDLMTQTVGPDGVEGVCGPGAPACPPTCGVSARRSASCSSDGPPPTAPGCSIGEDRRIVLSDDRFVDNLVDMVIGAMTAPHLGG